MTPDAFRAGLDRCAVDHPPSRTRRIAALLPQIEAAMAEGSPRAQIVTALLEVGITITPHQLSNAICRLRRQQAGSTGLPQVVPAVVVTDNTQGHAVIPAFGSAPVHSPTPPALRYGAHDPRLLDEVMRTTPDMKALAKLAPKHPTQGKS